VPLPDDGLPVIERSVVRLVVLDAEGKLLLFHTSDLCNLGPGTWWVHATEAGADERQRLWQEAAGYNPAWERYQQRTQRAFPLVILTPDRE
jgi:F420H(2)-dependent quinone reductase